jgi:hypothetical protein
MKAIVSLVAVGLLTSVSAASAQSGQPNAAPPSAQNSGAGIQGAPGNKNGPPANAGTVGSGTSMDRQNPNVSTQDPTNIKGMPGNKNGPPARKPQE